MQLTAVLQQLAAVSLHHPAVSQQFIAVSLQFAAVEMAMVFKATKLKIKTAPFPVLVKAKEEIKLVDIDTAERCSAGRQETSALLNSELRNSTQLAALAPEHRRTSAATHEFL